MIYFQQVFAQARATLSLTGVSRLNDWLIARAGHEESMPRWRGPRLVAADGSTVAVGLRASPVSRAAPADQFLFGLFLPTPDLKPAASLHSRLERGEWQFFIEHLDRLSPDDLLLLDRGYPCRWLVAVLNLRARWPARQNRVPPAGYGDVPPGRRRPSSAQATFCRTAPRSVRRPRPTRCRTPGVRCGGCMVCAMASRARCGEWATEAGSVDWQRQGRSNFYYLLRVLATAFTPVLH